MSDSLTISELAEQLGMTARNIRAYQSKGLLYPPRISGRIAYYSGVHVARLQLILSLQREGFTLAAIKRLIENPGSYSAIVADRRRRLNDDSADFSSTVPVSEERIRATFPDLPADLTDTGLVWRDADGGLVGHTIVVGVARTLLEAGVVRTAVAELQTDAVRAGQALGAKLRDHLQRMASYSGDPSAADADRLVDLAKVAVHLSATAFEIGFLEAATTGAGRASTERRDHDTA